MPYSVSREELIFTRGQKPVGREIERSRDGRDDRADMRGIGNRDALLKRIH